MDAANAVVLLAFIFILALFLGLELIGKVPATLHTPLMSGSNAISGISLIGAVGVVAIGTHYDSLAVTLLGAIGVTFAAINVVGGYLVTNRMLAMFQKKPQAGDK
ncbi:MAG: NAD(P) transhydrogenase subunit alpha [Planctomycetota bacterium]|nr:MAG: NAD(P) transhydrogenase subunit alpha [Planctomycetota bacterium]